MKTKPVLSSDDVKKILAAAESHALKNQWSVTIAVADDGGHLLGMLRLDDAAPISSHIALAKAKTAALERRESRIYEEIINNGCVSFLSAPLIEGMLEGGVPIIVNGYAVGALGVSGVKSSEDAEIAQIGIAVLEV